MVLLGHFLPHIVWFGCLVAKRVEEMWLHWLHIRCLALGSGLEVVGQQLLDPIRWTRRAQLWDQQPHRLAG